MDDRSLIRGMKKVLEDASYYIPIRNEDSANLLDRIDRWIERANKTLLRTSKKKVSHGNES
jgi:hypothetical protein